MSLRPHYSEAVPADAVARRLHYCEARGRGDRGVYGVASALQYLKPGLSGKRVPGGDHAARPKDNGTPRGIAVSHGVKFKAHLFSNPLINLTRGTFQPSRFPVMCGV